MKIVTYKKTTRGRLIELLARIDYKVTRQSTDGTFMLIRLPNGDSTNYWLFHDRLEHRLDDNRGGATFYLKDCKFQTLDADTVCIMAKNDKSVFCMFHNFKSHREKPNRGK